MASADLIQAKSSLALRKTVGAIRHGVVKMNVRYQAEIVKRIVKYRDTSLDRHGYSASMCLKVWVPM